VALQVLSHPRLGHCGDLVESPALVLGRDFQVVHDFHRTDDELVTIFRSRYSDGRRDLPAKRGRNRLIAGTYIGWVLDPDVAGDVSGGVGVQPGLEKGANCSISPESCLHASDTKPQLHRRLHDREMRGKAPEMESWTFGRGKTERLGNELLIYRPIHTRAPQIAE
jgi:hypothetical protein